MLRSHPQGGTVRKMKLSSAFHYYTLIRFHVIPGFSDTSSERSSSQGYELRKLLSGAWSFPLAVVNSTNQQTILCSSIAKNPEVLSPHVVETISMNPKFTGIDKKMDTSRINDCVHGDQETDSKSMSWGPPTTCLYFNSCGEFMTLKFLPKETGCRSRVFFLKLIFL